MSEHMAKRLDIAQIGHVGKKIRILTTNENNKTITKIYYT